MATDEANDGDDPARTGGTTGVEDVQQVDTPGDVAATDRGDDRVEVSVIEPNLTPVEALGRADVDGAVGPDDVRVIGYPKFLLEYEVALSRPFLSDRKTRLSITVDGVNGGRLRNDVYPDLVERTLPRHALLNPRLDRHDATEKSRAVVRRYISFHFPSSILVSNLPDMEVLREDFAFALYWLLPTEATPDASRVHILDTVSGEVVEEGIELSAVSADRLSD